MTTTTTPVLSYTVLGEIMLAEAGESACMSGYGTADPFYVGLAAIQFGDINYDGTLN